MQIRSILPALLFVTTLAPLAAEDHTIRSIPNPRTMHGGFLSNPDNLVSEADAKEINQRLIDLEKTTGVEYAVVIVKSIGVEIPKEFATTLFNTWGIGKKGKDNGLLLLIVTGQRRWEFETGYGLEGILPDAKLKRIGEGNLPPHFRRQEFGKGILEVSKTVIGIIEANAGEVGTTDKGRTTREPDQYDYDPWDPQSPQMKKKSYVTTGVVVGIYFIAALALFVWRIRAGSKSPSKNKDGVVDSGRIPVWLLAFILVALVVPLVILTAELVAPTIRFGIREVYHGSHEALAIVMPYALAGLAVIHGRLRKTSFILESEKDPHKAYNALAQSHQGTWFAAVLFPVLYMFYGIYVFFTRRRLRSTPRACKKCTTVMNRLDEKKDDVYLQKGQVMEENLGSVDYDVWFCRKCENTAVEPYDAIWTSYEKCSKCSYKTAYVTGSRTVTSPTYTSTGTGSRDHLCKQCGHTWTTSYTIPMLVRSSSSSGGGSSGGSSSSSSSGGSSFGGGSSGGGGAGGSW